MSSLATLILSLAVMFLMNTMSSAASLPSLVFKSKVKCREEIQWVGPRWAQNKNGQIKYIHQENSTHTDIQLSQITLCRDVGSSCLSCQDKEDDIHDKVCQQQFREERLWVIGDNGRDLVMDSFWLPDGCQCVEVEVK